MKEEPLYLFVTNPVGAIEDFEKPFSLHVLVSGESDPAQDTETIAATVAFPSMCEFGHDKMQMDIDHQQYKFFDGPDVESMIYDIIASFAQQFSVQETGPFELAEKVDDKQAIEKALADIRHVTEYIETEPNKRVCLGVLDCSEDSRVIH